MKLPLVLVPGLLCDDAVWQPQTTALADIADITIADHGLLDSLDAMAEAILARAPERFALAGHSMGGRVAFEVIRRAPERVMALAILDSGFAPLPQGAAGEQEIAGRQRLVALARNAGMRFMGQDWLQAMVHPSRLTDRVLINSILDMIERKTPDHFEAQVRALLGRPDARPLLPRIACPALVLCGREDSWSPLAQHEEMAELIPVSRLVALAECGHMSTLEKSAEVSAAMRQWLRPSLSAGN
jgi:pimeloyl-ACP methyl ester carboxylesterase